MSLRITKVIDYNKSNKNNSQDREKCSIHSSESNKIEEPKVRHLLDSKLNIINQSEETLDVSYGYSQYSETHTFNKNSYPLVNSLEDLLLFTCLEKKPPTPILYKNRFLIDFNKKKSDNLPIPDTKQGNNNTVKYIPLERVNVSNDTSHYQNDLKVNVKIDEPFKLFQVKKIETNNLVKDEIKQKTPAQSDTEPTSLKDNIPNSKQENETTVDKEPPSALSISKNLQQTLISSAIKSKNGLEKPIASTASQTNTKLVPNVNKPTYEKVSTNQQTKIGLNSQRFLNLNPYLTKDNSTNNTKVDFCDYRSLSNNAFANELKSHPLLKENK